MGGVETPVIARPFSLLVLVAFASCSAPGRRVGANPALFATLPPSTQRMIRRGDIAPGFTPDMVLLARGNPTRVILGPSGTDSDAIWIYREEPVTAPNESIIAGFRRRVVYDPVVRGDRVIVEPIDPKAQPYLLPHDVRVTFRDGRVAAVDRVPSG